MSGCVNNGWCETVTQDAYTLPLRAMVGNGMILEASIGSDLFLKCGC